MKFAHISDLHLGMELSSYSLIEDQKYILTKMIGIFEEEKVDGVLIAGDVYDRSVASIEAIRLFEDFLRRIVKKSMKIFVISGNHDAAERLSFGRDFMEESGLFFSKVYDGSVEKVSLEDEFGKINVYLLPFVRPASVRFYNPDEKIEDFDDALRLIIKNLKINTNERNICIAHQNIVSAEHCDSELPVFGGLDGISSEIFSEFDYAALGHIHSPQTLGKNKNVRYCGTPLKYSLSEKNHKKSVTIIEFREKGNQKIHTVPLESLRDVREEKGTFEEIMKRSEGYSSGQKDDFVSIVLTDEDEVLNAYYKLKSVFPHILQMTYDNTRTRNSSVVSDIKTSKAMTPLEIFDRFYENRNGIVMSEEQRKYMSSLIDSIWEEN